MKTDYLYALETILPIKRLTRTILCLTYRCNSKCKTCTIWKMNYKDQLSFDDLKKYAFTKRKINDNYFAKIINVLKSMLNWSIDRGLEIKEHHRKFVATEKEKKIIFLFFRCIFKIIYIKIIRYYAIIPIFITSTYGI